METVKELNADV